MFRYIQIAFFFFLCSFLFISCKDVYIGPRDIKYKVTGDVSAVNLTIENSSGGTSQYSDQTLPWSYSFEASKDTFIYVSAQNQDSSGNIKSEIYVEGDRFKSSESSGAYCIATASGSTP